MKFLEYTINDLYSRYGDNMQDLTLVLPTRRAGLFAKEWLGRLAGNRPVFTPECTKISDLFDSLCPLKAAERSAAAWMDDGARSAVSFVVL